MNEVLASAGYLQLANSSVWHRDGYGSIDYSDGDGSEQALLETLRNASDVSVFSPELAAACVDWPSRYHLSTERANLLRPFSRYLTPQARVLEIGAGCGAVTRYLGETGASVLALEGSLRRASIARERTRELENVTVLAERFQDFAPVQRFDVVTLIGVLEYASLFSDAENPALHMLDAARKLLSPGGRLLLAIENQLGLKYLAGVPEDHLGQPMVGLEDRYPSPGARTYGRHELALLLKRAGYGRSRFYAPLPDYKMPATILTEHAASADPDTFDAGTLAAQAVRRDPQLTPTTFNLQRAWPVAARNALALDLANSFLVEAVEDASNMAQEPAFAYHYSTQRVAAYARETTFLLAQDRGARVHSQAISATVQDGQGGVALRIQGESDYLRGTLLVDDMRAVLGQQGWTLDAFVGQVRVYLEALGQILQKEGHGLALDHLGVVLPDDFIDATPSNLMRWAGGNAYFDREWVVERPTLGWLLLRSLLFTYGGTPVAPMAAGPAITVRQLLLEVFSRLFADSSHSSFDQWLDQELAFQQQVTGKDQRGSISGMLESAVPRGPSELVAAAPATEMTIADGVASLQHMLNLAGQHGLNMHASLSALHGALGDGLAPLVPSLQQLQATAQLLEAGQGALYDRLVTTDDMLADSIHTWGEQQRELTARITSALEGVERGEAIRLLAEKLETVAAVQARQTALLEQLQQRRWWKFW